MKVSYLIILLVLNFFWAAVYSAYKIVGQDLPTGPIVTLRFGLAGVCLLAIWPWLRGSAPKGRELLKTCFLGLLLYVLGQRMQVYGNNLGTAGNSSVLMAVEPLITVWFVGFVVTTGIVCTVNVAAAVVALPAPLVYTAL